MPETHLEFSVPLRTCPDSQSHVLILPSAAQQLRLVIPDCGDTDSSAAPSAPSTAPISHWTTIRFCKGCPGRAARSMSQGLRVLVLDAESSFNDTHRSGPSRGA